MSTQTFWQILSKSVNTVATLLVLGMITRNYGESGTGIFTLSLTYLIFFYLVADLGLNNYFLLKYSKTSNEVRYLFSLRLVWSLILVLVANLLVFLMPFNSPPFQASILIGSLAIVLNTISVSSYLIFQANLKYNDFMMASSLGSLGMLAMAFLLVELKVPLPFVMVSIVFGWLINNVTALFLSRKLYQLKFKLPSSLYIKEIFKNTWPLSLTLILNTIYFRVDSFILASVRSIDEVAFYNLAYQIFQSILVIPTFIMNSFYPLMLIQLKENISVFFKQIKLAFLLLFLVSIFGIILTWFLAPIIIRLIAGPGFEESARILQLLSLSLPGFFLSSLLMWTLMSLGKFKTLFFIYLGGLIINLILNLTFIPIYGIPAAIAVTAACEYLILITEVVVLLVTRKLK